MPASRPVRALLLLGFLVAGWTALQAAPDWPVFKAPGGRFTCLLPTAQPSVQTEDSKDKEGRVTATSSIYLCKLTDGLVLVGETHYLSAIDTEKELELDCENFNKSVSATLSWKKHREYAGHPALEFESAGATHRFRSLVVMVGADRVFQLVAAHPLNGGVPDWVAPYLSSLTLGSGD